jgi:hypothetical protein
MCKQLVKASLLGAMELSKSKPPPMSRPLTYHLSPHRINLTRPLQFLHKKTNTPTATESSSPTMVLARSGKDVTHRKTAKAPFRILELPPELVTQVFKHLGAICPSTLVDARFVCRAFRNHSLVAFGGCFFEQVAVILHPISLTTLLEISKHQELSKFVRKVFVSGERIGGIIDLSNDHNESMLLDLQISMEKAGLDRLMLTEAFRSLNNIHTVRIDNSSYHRYPEMFDAARCGRQHICGNFIVDNKGGGEDNTNRAFDITFASLRTAEIHKKVKIQLDACHLTTKEGAFPHKDFFDHTAEDWRAAFSSNISLLSLYPHEIHDWALDLLNVSSNLQRLELFGDDEIYHFTHPTSGMFRWLLLQVLQMQDVQCQADTFSYFLDAHRTCLTHLNLRGIDIRGGTWKTLFIIIKKMPRLDQLDVGALSEATAPSQIGLSFNRFYHVEDWESYTLEIEGNAEIRVGIDALLYDFRTIMCGFVSRYGHLDPANPEYRVDIRLAQAIVLGKAEMRNGICELLD